MDMLKPSERSALMARIGGRNTKPELMVRHLLHGMGYRYRLHRSDLPGRPDIVFSSRRKAIFVHGCFWHRHPGCRYAYTPKTRAAFWKRKFERNVARDSMVLGRLNEMGWEAFVVWECELEDPEAVGNRLVRFLDASRADATVA